MNSLHVQEPWLTEIAEGRKDVEGRTGGPGKFAGWAGKGVRIHNGRYAVMRSVAAVRHYPDLASYLEAEGWERVAPHAGSAAGAARAYRAVALEDGTKVFSDERVAARGGIWAIELAPGLPVGVARR